jgi:hypothetical protein
MRGVQRRTMRGAMLATAALLALAGTASGAAATSSTTPPPPGSAVQIAELVSASPKITKLPAQTYPSIYAEASDSATHEFPVTSYGCTSTTECVFGDPTATQTIVLLGDSHAQMWLSAVLPAVEALHGRVVLLFLGGCPAASVTVWNPLPLAGVPAGPYIECNIFRAQAIKAINHLHPALVLLTDRTAMVESASGKYFTNAKWKAATKTTITKLKRPGTKVAVIGDIDYLEKPMPQCLAANPTSVQQCASPNPNPASHSNAAAERLAAQGTGAGFVNPLSWICARSCSPVVGNFLVYLNSTHLDATYTAFLSNVMQTAIQRLLATK